ncbi:LicD family protein [Paenibacillus alvei]|uniref:LicD family protein n=1 Tax=Paenibacillus alvei TaxID=44250 RepID=A0ABT4E6F9_PAEAL|nr:LicD family protein [Paenibacillus alvei]MCY9529210.1 LicD family protein [Paenibacillus alvei]
MKKKINYLQLNDEQLKKLQNDMLSMLLEVDRICRKYNITYFLSYGTLIGAIRHNGYIPWDDDIDIQMFREDYEKFCEVCKGELNTEKFFLQNQTTDRHYNWVYGKLRLKNTSFVRAGQEHMKQHDGMFLDILPLDYISRNKYRQNVSFFICKLCRKVLWSRVGKKSESNMFSRLLYYAVSFIPRRLAILIFEHFAKRDNKKETSLLASHNTFAQIYKREWYAESIRVEFEGHTFFAPKGYDYILSLIYGNYMELPSAEKRHGHCYASSIKFLDGTELKI